MPLITYRRRAVPGARSWMRRSLGGPDAGHRARRRIPTAIKTYVELGLGVDVLADALYEKSAIAGW
ncbi:hypothetical protein M8494_06925 [Serratia ureilytica]